MSILIKREKNQNDKHTQSLSRLDKYVEPLKSSTIYDRIIQKIRNKNGTLKINMNNVTEQTESKKHLFDDHVFNTQKYNGNSKMQHNQQIEHNRYKKKISLVSYGKVNGFNFKRNNNMFQNKLKSKLVYFEDRVAERKSQNDRYNENSLKV